MQQQKGFTIVEMLVVLAIIVILPTIIIANFPQTKLQFALSRVAYKFAQDVRRAQDMSLSSMQYKDALGTVASISGYGVYVDRDALGGKKYLLYADATPGNRQYDALDYVVQTIDFGADEPGVIIQEIKNVFGNTASINVAPPNPTTTLTLLNEGEHSLEVVFALESDASKTRSVLINTSGLVEVK